MYTQRSKYWPAYTWEIQKSYSSVISKNISGDFVVPEENFREAYFNIFNKINASFYHLECLKENEEIAIQIGKEVSKIEMPGMEGMIGIVGSPYEPINYEYEACLITIKSALDFMAMLLSEGFNRSEDNIVSLINSVQQLENIDVSTLKGKIYTLLRDPKTISFIENYKNSGNQKSKRNFAAHKGSLPVGTINIPINNPNAKILPSKALDPNNPDPFSSIRESQNLIEYCEDQFYQLCDFFIEILSLISNNKFEHGQKSSVYQQRVDNRTKD